MSGTFDRRNGGLHGSSSVRVHWVSLLRVQQATAQPCSGLSTFQHQRGRLYHVGPGNYVAVEDIESLQPGDLPLWKGMHMEGIPCTHRGMAVNRIQKQSEEFNIRNGETIQPSNHIGDGTTQGAFKKQFQSNRH